MVYTSLIQQPFIPNSSKKLDINADNTFENCFEKNIGDVKSHSR